jgi:hypothetical protein
LENRTKNPHIFLLFQAFLNTSNEYMINSF